jgi:hypothetical protein
MPAWGENDATQIIAGSKANASHWWVCTVAIAHAHLWIRKSQAPIVLPKQEPDGPPNSRSSGNVRHQLQQEPSLDDFDRCFFFAVSQSVVLLIMMKTDIFFCSVSQSVYITSI